VTLSRASPESCKISQQASIQIDPSEVITGKVVRVTQNKYEGRQSCEIGFSGPLPAGIMPGTQFRALIHVGEMRDIVF